MELVPSGKDLCPVLSHAFLFYIAKPEVIVLIYTTRLAYNIISTVYTAGSAIDPKLCRYSVWALLTASNMSYIATGELASI